MGFNCFIRLICVFWGGYVIFWIMMLINMLLVWFFNCCSGEVDVCVVVGDVGLRVDVFLVV